MPTRKEIEQHYQQFDRKETANNKPRPANNPSRASREELIQRAIMGQKLALNVINNKLQLLDPKGLPSPIAMRFRRWGYKLPKTIMAVRQILKQSRNYLTTINEEANYG
jgi:hypothetical protein|tara:strand:+ start:845 stop:1171 length:327 start_codon:yes stop_codon:yes gene_type:complete